MIQADELYGFHSEKFRKSYEIFQNRYHSAPTYLGFLIFGGLGPAASWLTFGATS